jgi:hypothetical protein
MSGWCFQKKAEQKKKQDESTFILHANFYANFHANGAPLDD